jgi:hypothetical protein
MFRAFSTMASLIAILATTGATFGNDKDKEASTDRASEKRLNRIWKTMAPVEGFERTEFFKAVETGAIEIKVNMKDIGHGNLSVTNKTDRPLSIEMPPAFATVPVLAQGGFGGPGGGGGGGFGGGGFGGGGGGQVGGGGFGGGGFGGGGFGGGGGGGFGGGGGGGVGGGGLFNIPPGRVGRVDFQTICLEHGKPDPRPRMNYTIKPLSTVSTDPKIYELCRMLANDEVTQLVAQAAAWNIANGLSWDELLVKNRVELMGGYYERYFTPTQLQIAHKIVDVASERAEERMSQTELKNNETYSASVDRKPVDPKRPAK